MEAYLKAISYYLPKEVLTNEQLNKNFPEWSVDKISSKTGIYERHISALDETAGDMGIKAAEKLFEEWNIETSSIDFTIFCTQSPDYFLPTTACIIQNKLGLPQSSGAIDINMGCSGYIYGLSLAKGLIVSNTAKNVLLITSETYTKYINRLDKSNRTIFGDGATANLISKDDTNSIGCINDFIFQTDGSGYDSLIVRNGASRHYIRDGKDIFNENIFDHNDNDLYMNGKDIFNFTASEVPSLIKNILNVNSLNQNDIDLFIFHQANQYMMNFIRKKIGIDEEKFYIYLRNVGNTVSSTIPIALYNAYKENRVNGNILLAGFGVGLSMGGVVITKLNI